LSDCVAGQMPCGMVHGQTMLVRKPPATSPFPPRRTNQAINARFAWPLPDGLAQRPASLPGALARTRTVFSATAVVQHRPLLPKSSHRAIASGPGWIAESAWSPADAIGRSPGLLNCPFQVLRKTDWIMSVELTPPWLPSRRARRLWTKSSLSSGRCWPFTVEAGQSTLRLCGIQRQCTR
jgi:hypothetical protein